MGKRVLYIVMALVLIGFAYVGYNSYDVRRAGGTGDVFSRDSGEKVGTDSGAKVTVSVPAKASDDEGCRGRWRSDCCIGGCCDEDYSGRG